MRNNPKKRIIHAYLQNRTRVRINLFLAVTKEFVSLTTKAKASNVTVPLATRDNIAVSITEFNAKFKNVPEKVLMIFLQTQKVVTAGLKMDSHQVAYTRSIQMAANQYKCCVT